MKVQREAASDRVEDRLEGRRPWGRTPGAADAPARPRNQAYQQNENPRWASAQWRQLARLAETVKSAQTTCVGSNCSSARPSCKEQTGVRPKPARSDQAGWMPQASQAKAGWLRDINAVGPAARPRPGGSETSGVAPASRKIIRSVRAPQVVLAQVNTGSVVYSPHLHRLSAPLYKAPLVRFVIQDSSSLNPPLGSSKIDFRIYRIFDSVSITPLAVQSLVSC